MGGDIKTLGEQMELVDTYATILFNLRILPYEEYSSIHWVIAGLFMTWKK